MASKVTTLFEDSAKTNALYPRTKVSAVSDNNGNGLEALLNAKQNQLVSGTNIKTINGESLVGAGDIEIGKWAIDGNNILASGTNLASYTATQDCFISFYSSTNVNSININGSNVWFGQTSTWMTFGYYLMKGNTISFGSSNQVNGYKVFGLM